MLSSSIVAGVLAAGSLTWQAVSFFVARSAEAKNRELEAYHRLIKEITQPAEDGKTYQARQCAALFELRRFSQYWEITTRILTDLQQSWQYVPMDITPVKRELTGTLQYIASRN